MGVCDHIHWYITGRCNLDCSYCFKPNLKCNESKEQIETIATILANNSIKHVTIGGGEPTLVKSLDNALKILKEADVYTSIHTNALKLTSERVYQLRDLVDDIAIPIDSMDPKIQGELKGIDYLPIFKTVIKDIQKNDIGLVYHTVFTAINHKSIEKIYDYIKDTNFSYWRIYEFNPDLVWNKYINLEKLKNIEKLQGTSTPKRSY